MQQIWPEPGAIFVASKVDSMSSKTPDFLVKTGVFLIFTANLQIAKKCLLIICSL